MLRPVRATLDYLYRAGTARPGPRVRATGEPRSRMDLGLNVYPERKKSKGTWLETATAIQEMYSKEAPQIFITRPPIKSINKNCAVYASW